jgi:formylmethanofuran dehydrogenase subunit B
LDSGLVKQETGIDLARWQDLMLRMKSARYGVVFYSAELARSDHQASCDALLMLVREMNRHTRFVCLPNRGRGNAAGAKNVVAWRTGYPPAVNLARGYPRHHPGEYTAAALLDRREVDAALILASDPLVELSKAARSHLRAIPYVAIDCQDTATMRHATVAFHVATCGIHASGTVYRMDNVPISLRPALASRHPTDLEILRGIESRLRPVSDMVPV